MYTNLLDAIIETLEKHNGVAHYEKITKYIIDNNLYDFSNSQTPSNSVSEKLQRYAKKDIDGRDNIFYNVYGEQNRKGVWGLVKYRDKVVYADELDEEGSKRYVEGSKKTIIVNAYERNTKAREECIKAYGTKCSICGFDFGKVYGDLFKNKIHVHHRIPLNEIDSEYTVNPKEDLIPVCPNCHMVLHSKVGGTYTVEDVKKFIDEQRDITQSSLSDYKKYEHRGNNEKI